MPVQHQTNPTVTPADLPRDTLITFDQFKHLMGPQAPQRQTIEKSARAGQFVPGTRMTARSPMLFRAGAVADFLAERMSHLDVGSTAAPVDLDAMIDSLNRDSSDAEVEIVGRAIMANDPPADHRNPTFIRFAKVLGLVKPAAWKLLKAIEREAAAEARG